MTPSDAEAFASWLGQEAAITRDLDRRGYDLATVSVARQHEAGRVEVRREGDLVEHRVHCVGCSWTTPWVSGESAVDDVISALDEHRRRA